MNIRRALLVDGLGAFTTTALIAGLLVPFQEYVGLPIWVLYTLSGIALSFTFYSLGNYAWAKSDFSNKLLVIMRMNMAYCVLTATTLIIYAAQIKWLGWAYFSGEILVILALVYVENSIIERAQ